MDLAIGWLESWFEKFCFVKARASSPGFGFTNLKPKPKPPSSHRFGLAWLAKPGLWLPGFRALSQAKHITIQDHRYIFPVDPATNRLKGELPFHHESIIAVLKKAVFTGQFRTKNLPLFASTSIKHPNGAELPDAMVGLAATAVYGALVEYRSTGTLQNIPFTEGAYEDVYRNHMRTLSDTRASAQVALHRVLHKLYNLSL
ncbi:hypothetical protein B0H19DRAFT_1276167 [Mycena capillaripes]|nr:hypothetical protein B0H19DRAFT_1276167 [Mycena capillaripes]